MQQKTEDNNESLKTEDNNALPTILPRGDKMNKKAEEVNNVLEKVCNQRQIGLINHSNINTTSRINRSKLHLNGYEKSLYGILETI